MSWYKPSVSEGRSEYRRSAWERIGGGETGGGFRPMVTHNGDGGSGVVTEFLPLMIGSVGGDCGGFEGGIQEESALDEAALRGVREEAFAEGFDAGKVEGEQAGYDRRSSEVRLVEERLRAVEESLNQGFQEAVAEIEKKAVLLALDVARKILKTTAEIKPDYITDVLRHAFSLLGGKRPLRIRLAPKDYDYVVREGVRERISGEEWPVEYVADDSVEGGCVVDTDYGEVDLELDRMWEQVRHSVLQAYK